MALSNTAIINAKPRDKNYRLYDEKGLYLEVTKSGGKLWRLKYRFGGKEKRLAIGLDAERTTAEEIQAYIGDRVPSE